MAADLGFLGEDVVPDDYAYNSKVFGRAVWLPDLPGSAPSVPVCKACAAPLQLVLQLHAPAPETDERILYVFACANGPCGRQSLAWTVLRLQTASQPAATAPAPPAEPAGVVKAGFKARFDIDDDSDNDDGDNGIANAGSGGLNSLEALLQQRDSSLAAAPAAQPAPPRKGCAGKTAAAAAAASAAAVPGLLQPRYVYLDAEPQPRQHGDGLGVAAQQQQHDDDEAEQWQAEEFEEDPNRVFQRFQRVTALAPSQVLRYGFDGVPALPVPVRIRFQGSSRVWHAGILPDDSDDDDAVDDVTAAAIPVPADAMDTEVPTCDACGSARVFELQLMPQLLAVIQQAMLPRSTGASDATALRRLLRQLDRAMDWSSVLVFTCQASCSARAAGVYIEHVVVLPPADEQRSAKLPASSADDDDGDGDDVDDDGDAAGVSDGA